MSEALYYPLAVSPRGLSPAALRTPTLVRQLRSRRGDRGRRSRRARRPSASSRRSSSPAPSARRRRALDGPFRRMLPTLVAFAAFAAPLDRESARDWAASGRRSGAYATLAEAAAYSLSDVSRYDRMADGGFAIADGRHPAPRARHPRMGAAARAGAATRASGRSWRQRRLPRRDGGRGRCVCLTFRRAHHRAAAAVDRSAGVRRVRRLARTRAAAAAAGRRSLTSPSRSAALGAAPAGRADHDPSVRGRRAVHRPARAPAAQRVGGDLRGHLRGRIAAAFLLVAVLVPRRAAPVIAGVVALALATGTLLASHETAGALAFDATDTLRRAPVDWLDAERRRRGRPLVTGDQLLAEHVAPDLLESPPSRTSCDCATRGRPASSRRRSRPSATTASRERRRTRSSRRRSSPRLRPPLLPASRSPPSRPTDEPGMTLWRRRAALCASRSGSEASGRTATSTVASAARIEVFACAPGELQAHPAREAGPFDPHQTRRTDRGRRASDTRQHGSGARRCRAPLTPTARAAACYELESDGLVGSTRIEYVPHRLTSATRPSARQARREPRSRPARPRPRTPRRAP